VLLHVRTEERSGQIVVALRCRLKQRTSVPSTEARLHRTLIGVRSDKLSFEHSQRLATVDHVERNRITTRSPRPT
jgi:hypothetical protein